MTDRAAVPITVRGISKTYGRVHALDHVDLDVKSGEFLAIVGPSGSGKSTLTKLLARLYQPEGRTVLVDSIDSSQVELYSLRRQLGIVPQETVRFDGSDEENIPPTQPDSIRQENDEATTNDSGQPITK